MEVEYNVVTEIGNIFVVVLSDKQEFEVGHSVFVHFPEEKINIFSL